MGRRAPPSGGHAHPASDCSGPRDQPLVLDIDEHRDIFQLDATHHIKATDFGVGVRYETGKLDDALKMRFQWPGRTDRAEDHRQAGHHL